MHLLALHGFTGRGADFAPLRAALGERHGIATAPIAWHSPDLPGHGPSPQLDCGPAAMATFVQARRSLFDPGPPSPKVLLGYSMGARAALLHATAEPEAWDALILVSPNPGIEDESERSARRRSDADLAERIERDGVEAFLAFWQEQALIRSQQRIPSPHREAMRANRLAHTSAGLAASLRQFGQGSFPNLWPELPKLKTPVILVTGGEDEKYTAIARRMQALLPKALHLEIDSSGHAPQLEASVPLAHELAARLSPESLHGLGKRP